MDGLNGNLIKITNMQISLVENFLCYTISTKSNWLIAFVLLGVNHSFSRRLSSCFTKGWDQCHPFTPRVFGHQACCRGHNWHIWIVGRREQGWSLASGCWETLHSHFSDCGLGAPAVHSWGGTMCCNNYTHIGVHFLCSVLTTRHMEVHNWSGTPNIAYFLIVGFCERGKIHVFGYLNF